MHQLTFNRFALQTLHPVRLRLLLVFLGRGGAGLYMIDLQSSMTIPRAELYIDMGRHVRILVMTEQKMCAVMCKIRFTN